MRVLIQSGARSEEIIGRKKYLYDIFKLYYVNNMSFNNGFNGFILLESFPKQEYDIMILKGHYDVVYNYLLSNNKHIYEHTIVVITCYPEKFKKLRMHDKKLYFPKVDLKGKAILYSGIEFGFNFDITDSEIDLYNNKNDSICKRIEESFVMLL